MAATVQSLTLRWAPRPWDTRVDAVLAAWNGTRYMAGQQARGRYVDCVRFVAGVLDDLFGFARERCERLPADMSLHDPDGARAALRTFLRLYEPNVRVEDGSAESGDVLVVGPPNGGPGHALIHGGRRAHLWQAGRRGVERAGYTLDSGVVLRGIYRVQDKAAWLR